MWMCVGVSEGGGGAGEGGTNHRVVMGDRGESRVSTPC